MKRIKTIPGLLEEAGLSFRLSFISVVPIYMIFFVVVKKKKSLDIKT